MTFTLTIETDNDAFQPDPAPELARILEKLSNYIMSGAPIVTTSYETDLPIQDANGNTCGRLTMKEDPE